MKKYLLVSFLFFAALNTMFSQNKTGTDQTSTSSYITFSPLSLLDFYTPRLRFGYIQHLGDHWKIGLDLGAGGGTGIASQRESEDGTLWEVRPEVFYILKAGSRTPKYISAEFFYIDDSITLLNDGYQRKDGVDLIYDKVDFGRRKYGMHLKFGLFLNLGRRWGFNFYGGIGFRFKDTSFENLVNAREGSVDRNRHGFITIYEIEENDFKPNPALGFKLYYKL